MFFAKYQFLKISLSAKFVTAIFLLTVAFAVNITKAQQPVAYPKTVGFFGISNAIGTWTKDGFTSNFSNVYSVSFPMGINLLKSDHFGFSFEVSPCIRTENNISKVSSVSFNPGAMFRFDHGFTLFTRLGFETNGRFGFGPTFSKVVKKGKDASCFVSIPVPLRFGNNSPASISTGVIVGVSF